MSGTGRHRGKVKTEEELQLEAHAKGHREEHSLVEQTSGEQNRPILNENFGHLDRGHQKGFGRNQGKEGRDMNTEYGTRAMGGEHG